MGYGSLPVGSGDLAVARSDVWKGEAVSVFDVSGADLYCTHVSVDL